MGAPNRVWNDFSSTTIPAARFKGMGIIGMKVMAYGLVPEEDRSLYLRFAVSQAVDVAMVGMDTVEQVEENVRAADDFVPLSADEERRVLDKALEIARGDKKTLWFLPEERVQGD